MNNIIAGIDAFDFVNSLEGNWDCIVWDPPYWSENGKDRGTRLNEHTKLEKGDTRFFSDPIEINTVKRIIDEKKAKSGFWIIFHSDPQQGYEFEHIWYKGKSFGGMGAGYQTRNDEYVYLQSWGGKKATNLPGLPRVLDYPAGKFGTQPRRCYKPMKLFRRLFKHVNATKVLDPFAGWGDSINAALELGISIDACDIDDTLSYEHQIPVETKVENYFD